MLYTKTQEQSAVLQAQTELKSFWERQMVEQVEDGWKKIFPICDASPIKTIIKAKIHHWNSRDKPGLLKLCSKFEETFVLTGDRS